MEIFDKVDGILATLEVPFYNFMPEFAREPPDLFVTYNVYDTPALRGGRRRNCNSLLLHVRPLRKVYYFR